MCIRDRAAITRAEGSKQSAILQAEGRKEAAFRDAEARERMAGAEAQATKVVSDAIETGSVSYTHLESTPAVSAALIPAVPWAWAETRRPSR